MKKLIIISIIGVMSGIVLFLQIGLSNTDFINNDYSVNTNCQLYTTLEVRPYISDEQWQESWQKKENKIKAWADSIDGQQATNNQKINKLDEFNAEMFFELWNINPKLMDTYLKRVSENNIELSQKDFDDDPECADFLYQNPHILKDQPRK